MKVRNLRRLLAMLLVIIMALPTVVFATGHNEQWNQFIELDSFAPLNTSEPIVICVTTPDMDNIGAVLSRLGIVFQVISPSQLMDLAVILNDLRMSVCVRETS